MGAVIMSISHYKGAVQDTTIASKLVIHRPKFNEQMSLAYIDS